MSAAEFRLAPSATYKWGRLSFDPTGAVFVIGWFKTRRAAFEYARLAGIEATDFAIARYYAPRL